MNPRDVVSVPVDCAGEKMRVCRYKVLETIDAPETEPVAWEGEPDLWEDDWDYDEADDVVSVRNVRSSSNPSVFYTVTEYGDGTSDCTCPGFEYRGYCKHS